VERAASLGDPEDLQQADELMIPWITDVLRERNKQAVDRLDYTPASAATA
jgi:hypothetical protein